MENKLKEFDEKLMKLYSNIISACLEYTQKQGDYVYVLGTCEHSSVFSNQVFFKVNENICNPVSINQYLKNQIDTSGDAQSILLDYLMEDFERIHSLFVDFQGEAPTEIKLKYDIKKGRFGADISYDKRMEKSSTLTPNMILNEWMEACEKGNDGFDW